MRLCFVETHIIVDLLRLTQYMNFIYRTVKILLLDGFRILLSSNNPIFGLK